MKEIKNKEKLALLKKEIKWIFRYVKKHMVGITANTLLGFSGTIFSLFGSVASKDLVDIITGHNTGELLKTAVMLVSYQLITLLVSEARSYFSTIISSKVENDIKADVYERIMLSEWESLQKLSTGALSSRYSGDTATISNGILGTIPNILIAVFRLVSSLVVVCQYDWTFAIIAFISAPLTLFASRRSMARMRKQNMTSLEINSELYDITTDSFSNNQTVKALDMVPRYTKRLKEIQSELVGSRLKSQRLSSVNVLKNSLLAQFITYCTYAWGIYKVWSGQITYGTMTLFISLTAGLSGTISGLFSYGPSLMGIANAVSRIMSLDDLPKEDYSRYDEAKEFLDKNRDSGFSLVIKEFSFAYSNGTEVFDSVGLEAYPRETVALIGPSGEGKTTMLRYILSLIASNANCGKIYAGDIRTKKISEEIPLCASVRQLIAYVPQGNTMLRGTIAENLKNVKPEATDEEVVEALKLACAWDFVSKLPDGINTEMQERGGGFSEGQAQRLSIARALLKKAPILLLDEATSALDIDTQKRVLDNIANENYPRTCIVTTHRREVMDICDRVYIISGGRITEKVSES